MSEAAGYKSHPYTDVLFDIPKLDDKVDIERKLVLGLSPMVLQYLNSER